MRARQNSFVEFLVKIKQQKRKNTQQIAKNEENERKKLGNRLIISIKAVEFKTNFNLQFWVIALRPIDSVSLFKLKKKISMKIICYKYEWKKSSVIQRGVKLSVIHFYDMRFQFHRNRILLYCCLIFRYQKSNTKRGLLGVESAQEWMWKSAKIKSIKINQYCNTFLAVLYLVISSLKLLLYFALLHYNSDLISNLNIKQNEQTIKYMSNKAMAL